MPMIRVDLLKGRTVEQKREFAKMVTREAVKILKCPPEAVEVLFQDVSADDWIVGGQISDDPET